MFERKNRRCKRSFLIEIKESSSRLAMYRVRVSAVDSHLHWHPSAPCAAGSPGSPSSPRQSGCRQSWAWCWSGQRAAPPHRRLCSSLWRCGDCSPRSITHTHTLMTIETQMFTQICRSFLESNGSIVPLSKIIIVLKPGDTVRSCLCKTQTTLRLTSPRWESPKGPLVSVLAMITFTPGRIYSTQTSDLKAWAKRNPSAAQGHTCFWCFSLFTRWRTFPDSISGKLCGDPLSTKRTLKK